MGGCLTLIGRLIVDVLLAKIVQELLKRITVDGIVKLIAAILALFGIRIKRPGQ